MYPLPTEDPGIETVADLIDRLSRFPKDAPVAISDADTDWNLRIEFVGIDNDDDPRRVIIAGQYHGDLPAPSSTPE